MARTLKFTVVAAVAALVVLTSGGVAMAVSGGGYDPAQQDCPPNADSTAQPKQTTVPGCHAFKINVEDTQGNRYAEFGVDQLPDGYPSTPGLFGLGVPGSPNFPHAGCLAVNTNGTDGHCGAGTGAGFNAVFDTEDTSRTTITPATGTPDGAQIASALTNGLLLYLGADDNLDAGEHDGASGNNGTDRAINGPSDGGAVKVSTSPGAAADTPTLTDPVRLLSFAFGFCADGICIETTTRQQALYHGNPDSGTTRDAANYDGKQWDPYTCSSGSPADEQSCHDSSHSNMNDYRNSEAGTVNAEPGVQVYEDPDPQGSPIDPFFEGGAVTDPVLYPLVGAYVGTCGVILGGGPAAATVIPPGSLPMMNSAGQVVVPTGC